jgi:hypothetical protein
MRGTLGHSGHQDIEGAEGAEKVPQVPQAISGTFGTSGTSGTSTFPSPENPTIACHHDEGVVQYPPSPCCREPIEPDEEGIAVCVGCGRIWQWARTSWHPANPPPADPDPFDRARLWLSEDDVF